MPKLIFVILALALGSAVQASNDQPHILILGDSLSASYGIEVEQGWVTLLKERLSDDYPYKVINASVSGETSGGGLARLPALLKAHSPEIVILELGGNDGLRGHPANIMKRELGAIIEQSQASGARVLLVGIQIPPNYGARYSRAFADTFPQLAKEHQIPLVPFLLEGIATDRALMQDDGIHPKAEAQAIMLENVWPYLEAMLGGAGAGLADNTESSGVSDLSDSAE